MWICISIGDESSQNWFSLIKRKFASCDLAWIFSKEYLCIFEGCLHAVWFIARKSNNQQLRHAVNFQQVALTFGTSWKQSSEQQLCCFFNGTVCYYPISLFYFMLNTDLNVMYSLQNFTDYKSLFLFGIVISINLQAYALVWCYSFFWSSVFFKM